MNELWERLDPGFFEPIWLVVGLLAVVALLLLERGASRRRLEAVRLFAASHLVQALTASVSPARRLAKRILLITAVALVFIALARPHLFYDWREETRNGLDVLIAVDCSKSMLTEDVKPNRLERAKLAISDFADNLPDNRLGLIAFAGDAFLQCPLTIDHEAFQTAVRELDTDTIPRPGTDIATAIEQAVTALKSQPNNLKILILVTDGEDLEGRVLDAAKVAAQAGLKIYTVGVGTPEGGLIPQRDDSGAIMYLHDSNGDLVQSKLDENTLTQIASITGGAYVPLGQQGQGLEEIYDKYIAPLPKQNFEERREKVRFEQFEWPLGLAILLLMGEFLISERVRGNNDLGPGTANPNRKPIKRRVRKPDLVATSVVVVGLLLGLAAGPARAAATTDTAEQDYKSGKFEDALENYREATESQPDRSDLQFNRGDAAYKAGNYPEAEEAFRKSLNTPDLDLQEKTYFNLGNTQFKDGEGVQKVDTQKTIDLWEKALQSYQSALKLKDAADSRHNYEVVKEKLDELKKQQQQQQQNQNQNSPQSNKQDQSGKDSPQNQDKDQKDKQAQNQNKNSQQGKGQNSQQNQPSPGDQSQQAQNQPGQPNNDQNGQQQQQQQQQPSPGSDKEADAQQKAYSQGRAMDKQDPQIKSREEAEALLDSLKEDEHQVTARTLNGDNEPPPPPPSGKDW